MWAGLNKVKFYSKIAKNYVPKKSVKSQQKLDVQSTITRTIITVFWVFSDSREVLRHWRLSVCSYSWSSFVFFFSAQSVWLNYSRISVPVTNVCCKCVIQHLSTGTLQYNALYCNAMVGNVDIWRNLQFDACIVKVKVHNSFYFTRIYNQDWEMQMQANMAFYPGI